MILHMTYRFTQSDTGKYCSACGNSCIRSFVALEELFKVGEINPGQAGANKSYHEVALWEV